jgi:alpha-amylase/alpha-mannosidase (GH57 family)
MAHPPALVVHGHFYQPPRENPWTGMVDREPSAAPFHDWNERIHAECYRPNGWARIFDDAGDVLEVVNNYDHLSFNFGPTLLSWMERQHAESYRRILAADKRSQRARGHGNAIAQGYNHAILPLCNDRDLRTQVRWGVTELRKRFGRDPEALWLPETACDDRTLGVLIDHGLRYLILAPGQAARVRRGGGAWRDVRGGHVDPRVPYRYFHRDGSGRSIAVFFYDAGVSRAVAFEGALHSSQGLCDRFERASGGPGTVVQAATDGESYGHHFKFGDRCLAHALFREAERRGFWVTNYGALLDVHPPEDEVELHLGDDGRGSSWSCTHGVGRWWRDCGCQGGGKPGWTQAWRQPLRAALDWLRDRAAEVYEARMGELCAEPWAVRDAYAELVVDRAADRAAFFERHAGRSLDADARVRALGLLEMQRSSLLMYTSCGWFFSELSGIETLQVMRYAGRLLDQLADAGLRDLEAPFLEQLAEAKSNLREKGSGADLYRAEVSPSRTTDAAIAAHVAIGALVEDLPGKGDIADRRYRLQTLARSSHGRVTLATSRIGLEGQATGQKCEFAACALHFGGVEVHAVLRPFAGVAEFEQASDRIWQAFASGSLLTLLRVAEEELGHEEFGISSVLPEAREALSRALFAEVRGRYAAQYEAMYREAVLAIAQFHDAGLPLPQELRTAAQLALAYRFDEEIDAAPADVFDGGVYRRALAIAEEAQRYGCELRTDAARRHFEAMLERLMHRVCAGDRNVAHAGGPTAAALELLELGGRLRLDLHIDRAQEMLHDALRQGLEPTESLRRLARALDLSRELVGQKP